MAGPVPPRVDGPVKARLLELVDHAVGRGWSTDPAGGGAAGHRYGYSSPRPGRRVVDAAADVVAILDTLDLDRVPLIGVSGGGPHALAAAAAHLGRVTKVGILASPAPRNAEGLDWMDGMMEQNRAEAEAATSGGATAVEAVLRRSEPAVLPELPANERAILNRSEVREMLTAAYAEAVRPGLAGAVEDTIALFGTPWGFDAGGIGAPVRIWHGEQDGVVPAAHARWVAAWIPTAELICQPGVGHVGHFDAQPAILTWLVDGAH